MPAQQSEYVAAKFGGEQLNMRISRTHIMTTGPAFMCLDEKPFDQYRRLLEGTWTIKDVMGPIQAGLVGAKGGLAFSYEKVVRAVLIKNGPARYVKLAGLLLEHMMLGVKPEEATFDEDADG